MYLTVKQCIKRLSKEDYNSLNELCRIAKNLKNEAIYNARQYYFKESEYLNNQKNYVLLKNSPNYQLLNSHMAQQIIKEVDGSFKSFFATINLAKKGKCSYKDCRLPEYLPKDGCSPLIISYVRIKDDMLVLPFSNIYRKTHSKISIKIPPILHGKRIREIRIIPKNGLYEIQYIYVAESIQRDLDQTKALAIDIGLNNLVAGVTNHGNTFILDGKRLKSINNWYNKENQYLQKISDKQGIKSPTKRQLMLDAARCNKINDYMNKAACKIIDYCIYHNIGVLVVGYNETIQHDHSDSGVIPIPYGLLRFKLEYLCKLNSIRFVKQEESYTSDASFWDHDEIPTYNEDNPEQCVFSGKRIHRGMYQCSYGKTLNADINGALNILKKSNVVSLTALYDRGEVDTPVRIRIE